MLLLSLAADAAAAVVVVVAQGRQALELVLAAGSLFTLPFVFTVAFAALEAVRIPALLLASYRGGLGRGLGLRAEEVELLVFAAALSPSGRFRPPPAARRMLADGVASGERAARALGLLAL